MKVGELICGCLLYGTKNTQKNGYMRMLKSKKEDLNTYMGLSSLSRPLESVVFQRRKKSRIFLKFKCNINGEALDVIT